MRLKKIIKYFFLFGISAFLLIILVVFLANYKVQKDSQPYIYNDIEKVPKTKVALVLGTSKRLKGGYVNHYFKYRIDAALDLYRAKKVERILVSGDNGSKYYNEPMDMKKELMKGGVPEKVIFLDYAGFRTYDSVIRSQKVFGQDSILIVSQEFHNQRAVCIAQHFDIHAVAFNAHSVNNKTKSKIFLREKLARVKLFLDLLTQKQPKFLGKKIIIP